MKKFKMLILSLLLVTVLTMLSGCKVNDEDNVYYDNGQLAYALIVLSQETNFPTSKFTFVSEKNAFWEWEDGFVKFKDSDNNTYIVKVYYNDVDYKISVNGEVLVDTMIEDDNIFE